MTVELKINLTDEEKNILSKARELANDLDDAIREAADNVTGLEKDVVNEMYARADICQTAWSKLVDLCDEFDVY